MATQAEINARIAKLETELDAAIRSVTTDGTSTSVDLQAKREQLDRLKRQSLSGKMRRPTSAGVNLGGFQG